MQSLTILFFKLFYAKDRIEYLFGSC